MADASFEIMIGSCQGTHLYDGIAIREVQGCERGSGNRLNSLSGAARAAKRADNDSKAKTYYAKLLSICEHADGDRPEIEEARSLLAEK